MSKIYVVRHGQSTWNLEQRWAGYADPSLTDIGRQQAKDSCRKLREFQFTGVSSSSLKRARETASIIADEIEVDLLNPVADLNERNIGDISGLTTSEIETKHPQFMKKWRTGRPVEVPGGESWSEFVIRVFKGLQYISNLPGRNLVVAHMGVLRAIEHSRGEPQSKHENLGGVWIDLA